MDPFGLPAEFSLPSSDEIDNLVTKCEGLSQSFNALGDDIEARIAKRHAEIRDEDTRNVRTLPLSRSELAGAMKAAEMKADKEAKRFRDGLLSHHEQVITDQMRQLNAANDRLQGVLKVYPSPAALLSSQHLGDPKRTEYLRQIEHAGKAELGTMARIAVATGNRALAAAVQSKLAAMPRDHRPFDPAAFAERVVGHEHAKLALAAKKANHAFQTVINRNRALQRGKTVLHEKLSSALRADDIGRSEPQTAA